MPLEAANFINQLNAANPAHTDQLNQDDSHMRMVKGTLLATFPNFTAVAMASTQAQIDAAVAATTNGVGVLADAGAFFKTNTTDGLTNPAAGEVDVEAAGVPVVKFKSDLSAAFQGDVTVVGNLTGSVPIGGTIVWWDDTLPVGCGVWAWANGQLIPNAPAICPALLARWGAKFGGDGTTTMGVPDMRDVTPVGMDTMGGTTSRGLMVTAVTSWVTNTLGLLFGESLHKLVTGELASHTHVFTGTALAPHSHTVNVLESSGGFGFNNGSNASYQNATTSAVSAGTPTGTNATVGSDTPHNNVQPSITCNWIIRIA